MSPVDLASLLALLRAVYQLHQAHHWQSRGKSYYADHLLYQRLYEEILPEIDAVAERVVGLSRDPRLVDPSRQAQATQVILEGFKESEAATAENVPPTEAAVMASLEAEMQLLRQIDALLATQASNGVQNLLQGIADKHEGHVYLLQQRLG
jgi:hypothetical protein